MSVQPVSKTSVFETELLFYIIGKEGTRMFDKEKEEKMELIVENDCQRLEGKGNRERILKVTHFHI